MTNVTGTSSDATISAVNGTNTSTPVAGIVGSSVGVEGQSNDGFGVFGHSVNSRGVVAVSENGYGLRASSTNLSGIRASSVKGVGVEGEGVPFGVIGSSSPDPVTGVNAGTGVEGRGDTGPGVVGRSNSGSGIMGVSALNIGVFGKCFASNHGVHGESVSGRGVIGISESFVGVSGRCDGAGGKGVIGESVNGIGVFGQGGQFAGLFEGDVQVSGTINVAKDVILTGNDCAEHFDVLPDALCEPGTVMAISTGGALDQSTKSYDKRVAGVVSGAGRFRPAILLDRQSPDEERPPIALAGKVYCKVDAQYAPIEIGDLLTSSDTPGHAMKAADPAKAFGSVIGKALGPLDRGCGMIPILVTLQVT
jgi:hypothetical protein